MTIHLCNDIIGIICSEKMKCQKISGCNCSIWQAPSTSTSALPDIISSHTSASKTSKKNKAKRKVKTVAEENTEAADRLSAICLSNEARFSWDDPAMAGMCGVTFWGHFSSTDQWDSIGQRLREIADSYDTNTNKVSTISIFNCFTHF